MKATETVLKDFLTQNKTQFIIPVYQRNYNWGVTQCEQLLEDLLDVGDKDEDDTHFVGSIVYIHDGIYTSSDVKQLVVIDGQQRLTTMTILYLALYRFSLDNGMEERASEINDTILINRYVKNEKTKLKLKQTDTSAKAFRFLMNNNNPADYNDYSRIIENYVYFHKRINSDNVDVIQKGLDRLLFVEISLERGKDDPQRIFESLNSTGLVLSQADLIRNYILMGLEPTEQIRVFENYWEIIENNARIEDSQDTKVSDLIRDFMTILNKKIPNKGNVYDEFKAKFKNRDSDFYQGILQRIKDYSVIYNKFLNPLNEVDKEIQRELMSIRKLEINVSYPFLLQVYNDYTEGVIDKCLLFNVLRLVQTYVWRRFIIGLPTNALNKIFMTLYGEIDKNDYLNSLNRALIKKRGAQRFPTDPEIEEVLKDKDMYNIQSKNKSYYFEQIEHYNNPEKVDVNSNVITIEHIFPKVPDQQWRKDLSEENYKLFSERYLHTIANLTLSGNNGSLSNKSFVDKKNMNKDNGRQGYLYSNLWLNEYLKGIDNWSVDTYAARYSLLISRFKNVWGYPLATIVDKSTEFTILEAPEPRYKSLEYFNFRDEYIVTNEFSKMYYHVLSELFNENPSKFLSTELREILFLTTNSSLLRSPFSISDNYFIESNLDSNTKFNKLKKVLHEFDLEDELSFKYAN